MPIICSTKLEEFRQNGLDILLLTLDLGNEVSDKFESNEIKPDVVDTSPANKLKVI